MKTSSETLDKMIVAYERLTSPWVLVKRSGDKWIIDTFEGDIVHDTEEDLYQDVKLNLEIMREIVDDDAWRDAWK